MSNPSDPFQRRNALAGLLSPTPSNPVAQPSPGVSALFGALSPSFQPGGFDLITFLNESYRRRSEWNDRFAHWERSESNAETQRIERARNMVQQALGKNRWLGLQFKRVVRIVKRLRADMSERGICHDKVPSFLVECLLYLVEDHYFAEPSDDSYGRVSRVINRLAEIFANPLIAYTRPVVSG